MRVDHPECVSNQGILEIRSVGPVDDSLFIITIHIFYVFQGGRKREPQDYNPLHKGIYFYVDPATCINNNRLYQAGERNNLYQVLSEYPFSSASFSEFDNVYEMNNQLIPDFKGPVWICVACVNGMIVTVN